MTIPSTCFLVASLARQLDVALSKLESVLIRNLFRTLVFGSLPRLHLLLNFLLTSKMHNSVKIIANALLFV